MYSLVLLPDTHACRSAFWGTLLPISPSPRVTDIWRGYWNQRLFWDIGARQAFIAPTVTQIRTPQSYLANFKAEVQLYEQATPFVRFLRNWGSCKATLFERMVDLAEAMEVARYWDHTDVALMKAWIEDLKALGYQPPAPITCQRGQSDAEKKIASEKAFVRPSYFTVSSSFLSVVSHVGSLRLFSSSRTPTTAASETDRCLVGGVGRG